MSQPYLNTVTVLSQVQNCHNNSSYIVPILSECCHGAFRLNWRSQNCHSTVTLLSQRCQWTVTLTCDLTHSSFDFPKRPQDHANWPKMINWCHKSVTEMSQKCHNSVKEVSNVHARLSERCQRGIREMSQLQDYRIATVQLTKNTDWDQNKLNKEWVGYWLGAELARILTCPDPRGCGEGEEGRARQLESSHTLCSMCDDSSCLHSICSTQFGILHTCSTESRECACH